MPNNVKKHYQKYTKANNTKLSKIIKVNWTDPIKYIREVRKIY